MASDTSGTATVRRGRGPEKTKPDPAKEEDARKEKLYDEEVEQIAQHLLHPEQNPKKELTIQEMGRVVARMLVDGASKTKAVQEFRAEIKLKTNKLSEAQNEIAELRDLNAARAWRKVQQARGGLQLPRCKIEIY
jgi:hypothetical protein